ncbi:MAG: hypothetical protein ACQESP_02570 [Candidatus Muiribacteriota bacterium]
MNFRILHMGNIFLGKLFNEYPSIGKKLRQKLRQSFEEKLTDLLKQYDIDAIIITGNLFGTNMFSEKDIDLVLKCFKKFNKGIYIIPGKSDEFNEVSIYNKINFSENVHVLKNDYIRLADKNSDGVYIHLCNTFDYLKDFKNGFNILCTPEFNNNLTEFNKGIILCSNFEEFLIKDNIYSVPPFEMLGDRGQQEAGVYILEIKNDGVDYTKVNNSSFEKKYIKINISDKEKRSIENILKDFYSLNNICEIIFEGEIKNNNMLKYVLDFERKNKDKFFYLNFIDNTVLSDEYIENIPEYREERLFARHLKNSKIAGGEKSINQLLKKGFYFY